MRDLSIAVGSVVSVGPRYIGNGYAVDGDTGGPYTVVGVIPGAGGNDYKLARGRLSGDAVRPAEWTVIVHESRIVA